MTAGAELDVLVVGAGPTGLAAAIEAARHGLSVRVVEARAGRSQLSRALVVHARTLEAFADMGVAGAVRAAGVPFAALNVTPVIGAPALRIDLEHLAWGDTRYPYWLAIPQCETERCLEARLAALGVGVEWRTSFAGLVDRGDHVEARIVADGAAQVCRARWLIGCDGGHSAVREAAGIGFAGAALDRTFVLADAIGAPGLPDDEGAVVLARDGVMFVVPMPEPGRWRIIAHLARHPADARVEIDAAFVDRLFERRMGVRFGARDLRWTSQFRIKQGVAASYRAGRVFLAGDAAHLHSPVGGQGLNTGVQDAHALVWRIALATRARPDHDALLGSYEAERRPAALASVRTTGLVTRLMTLRVRLLAALRGRVARVVLRMPRVQQRLGRGIGMLDLALPRSPVVIAGPAGASGPGRRLPDPEVGERRLCELLAPCRHSLLVLDDSAAGQDFAAEWVARGLHCVVVGAAALRVSLGGARLVIVRPDRVIAATAGRLDPRLVDAYARDRLGVAPEML